MSSTLKFLCLPAAALILNGQSLPPLGEPLHNAGGQSGGLSGVASVRFGPSCSGAFIAPSAAADAPAYVLSNGHCVDLLGTNEVILDRPGRGEAVFLAFADIPAGQRLRVPIRRVAYATQKGRDLSVFELGSTARELISRGIQPLRLAAAQPGPGDAVQVAGIPVTGVPEADRVIRLSRCAAGETVQLLEDRWHTDDAVRNNCIGIRGGSSGSPLLDAGGEIAGLIFTTTWGAPALAACAANRPCEVASTGTISPDETSYSTPVAGLAACFAPDGRFDILAPDCPLDPGRQLAISGYPLSPVNPNRPGGNPARPTPSSWNTKPQGAFRFFSYKTGPVESTSCRSPEGYAQPRPLQPDTLIDDPFPTSDSRLRLCVVAGDSASIDTSWQPFRFATQARVAIDTIPPRANPSANVNPGDAYIVLFDYLADEIAFYEYKLGPPGAIDCSDPAGYRPFVQRLFLSRDREPYAICAVPIDAAQNRGKPWAFTLNQIGFLNPASRASTFETLHPASTVAMTGDFPLLPAASLSTAEGTFALDTVRRDSNEIWLTLPAINPATLAQLRLEDSNGALSFPVRVAPGAPGIHTLDGSGQGAPAGFLIQPGAPLRLLSSPVPLDRAAGATFDIYATSILDPLLKATLGGLPIDIVHRTPNLLRLRVPPEFPLRGPMDLVLHAGALASNAARISIQ